MGIVATMGPRIACCNHKGGVGKTTCVVNVAAGLVRLGWRVLVVDADPQAHLTASLGLTVAAGGGLAGVLSGALPAARALVEEAGLAVLPASPALAASESELSRRQAPADLLEGMLADLSGFDAVFFDCPPHLGPLCRQVLRAANDIVVPMTPDFLAMQSLAWLMETLAGLSDGPSPRLPVLGIVLNRYDHRKRLHREVRETVGGHFPGLPFAAFIRENVALAEAPSHGQDIFRYAPASAGAKDFTALCREMTARLSAKSGSTYGRKTAGGPPWQPNRDLAETP
uniref:ATPase involved in chromosome partitioning n=1 Tax=Desulfovibrio sp. U5L TaxID=596152 RepID=I2Q0U4_9BACT